MLETIAGSILLAIAVLMFVLAGSGNKRLAVSATKVGAERDLFVKLACAYHASIAVDAKREFGLQNGRKVVGSVCTTERPLTRFQSAQRRVSKANQRNSFPTDLWLIPTTLHARSSTE